MWCFSRKKQNKKTLFIQQLVQAIIRGITKAPITGPLWGESTVDQWIPLTKSQWCGKCFHVMTSSWLSNTLKPGQNGWHFADDIFDCNFCNENCFILIKIPLKYVPKGLIYNSPILVDIMAWHRKIKKPLNQWWPGLVTHLCVSRPQ